MKFQSIVRVAPTWEQATVPLLKPVIFRNHDNFVRSFRFQNHHYFVVNNSLQLSHVFFRLVTLQVFEMHIAIPKIVFNTTKLLNRIVSISVGTYKVPIRVCRISSSLFFSKAEKAFVCFLYWQAIMNCASVGTRNLETTEVEAEIPKTQLLSGKSQHIHTSVPKITTYSHSPKL